MKINVVPQFSYCRSNANRNIKNKVYTPVSFGAENTLSNRQITKLAKDIMDIPYLPDSRFQFNLITFDLIAQRDLGRLNPQCVDAFRIISTSKLMPDSLQKIEDALRTLGEQSVKIAENYSLYKEAEVKAKAMGNHRPLEELAGNVKRRVIAELNVGQTKDISPQVEEIFIAHGLKRKREQ